jgi:hypothetical protein
VRFYVSRVMLHACWWACSFLVYMSEDNRALKNTYTYYWSNRDLFHPKYFLACLQSTGSTL